jgi:hypothetical protein
MTLSFRSVARRISPTVEKPPRVNEFIMKVGIRRSLILVVSLSSFEGSSRPGTITIAHRSLVFTWDNFLGSNVSQLLWPALVVSLGRQTFGIAEYGRWRASVYQGQDVLT